MGAMILLTVGAAACSVGLLEQQAAHLQADHIIGTATQRVAATKQILIWARVWLWTGIVAVVAGLAALLVALHRRRLISTSGLSRLDEL